MCLHYVHYTTLTKRQQTGQSHYQQNAYFQTTKHMCMQPLKNICIVYCLYTCIVYMHTVTFFYVLPDIFLKFNSQNPPDPADYVHTPANYHYRLCI